jgi:glycosyltransferase involved in cell wall biosynthesis
VTVRGRICLHAPYLYPVTRGNAAEFAGGAEVMQWTLARGLARRGYDVTIVTCDFGQPAEETREGVHFLRTYRPQAGLPVVRFFHPRLTRTVAALRRADADVYLVQGAGQPAGLTADVARGRGAAFLFLAAHDHDAVRSLPDLPSARDRWWYRRALRSAESVVAQTGVQQARFAAEFARASVVIPNPVAIPPHAVDPGQAGAVVWIATYKATKRPEWFTALAAKLPEQRFVMYGVLPVPPLRAEAYEAALAVARVSPNLEVRHDIVHHRLGEVFGAASLFVHTSPAEGFPNTFLEAWSFGVPGITTFDPDGVIARESLGEVVNDQQALAVAVRAWMVDPERRRAAGARARAYTLERHAEDAILDQYSALLDEAVAKVGKARRRS